MKHKKMINSLLLCSVILALCGPGISKDVVVKSTWATTPVNIDGSIDDWQGDTLTLFKKTKVDYAFRNDSENLYVLFIFKKPTREFMTTINETGMTIWLNTEGKNKKDYGIKFQIKTVTADNYIAILERMGMSVPEEKKEEIRKKPTYQVFHNEVIDKKGEASEIEASTSGPVFNFGGKKERTFEYRIPIQRGEGQPVGIGTEPGKTIKVGFEWGGLSDEMKTQRLAGQIEGGTAGRAGGGTGLTGERGVSGSGTGSSGLGAMRRIRAKKYSFWTDVTLAQK
jgi:hypothetical protein